MQVMMEASTWTAPVHNGIKFAFRSSAKQGFEVGDSGFRRFAAARSVVYPGKEAILDLRTPIKDQQGEGACVAFASCAAVEHGMAKPERLAEQVAYWYARRAHREECRDEGTYPHVMASVFAKLGVPLSKFYPYVDDGKQVFEQPTPYAEQQAYDNRVLSGHALPGDGDVIEDVLASLRRDKPVVGGWDVYQSFADNPAGNVYARPSGGRLLGGHCMALWGFRTRMDDSIEFALRNSWGSGWCDSGLIWVTEDFVRDISDAIVY